MTDVLTKRDKVKLKLESLRIFLIIALLIFLFIYASLAVYLKYLAHDAVDQAIAKIEATDPNINNITYAHLEFSPLDFLTQQLTLKDVKFHLNNPNINVSLASLTLQHFMSFTQNPLGPFEVNFTGAEIDQFTSVYGLITTWLNNPYLYSEFSNVPAQLELNLDGSAHYLPQNNHEIDLTLTLKNKKMQLFTYQIMVNNLNLTADFFNKLPVFLSTLNQSQIMHVHYQAAINYVITPAELTSISPSFAQYLQSLGYQNLPISINGNSDYNAKDTQETYNFNLTIAQLGTLNVAINYQILNPPSLANTVNQLLGTNNNNAPNAPDLIQSAKLSYQDNSLVHRIIQNLAQTSNQSVADTQNQIITMINGFAQNLNIPQMSMIAGQLNAFILNPGTLTINLQPVTPFSMNDVANFFITQQQRNQTIQAQLAKLSGAARDKAYNAYLKQSLNAYSNFFNRIGLSIMANSNS